ncbi:MAG: hypothetical protein H6Q42_4275, partial [Deltaproteobacteria bacterium]|nr:hypothetical protein [Deltaproteobacteria bacterium]
GLGRRPGEPPIGRKERNPHPGRNEKSGFCIVCPEEDVVVTNDQESGACSGSGPASTCAMYSESTFFKREIQDGKTIALFLPDLRAKNRIPDFPAEERSDFDLSFLQIDPHPPRPYAGRSEKRDPKDKEEVLTQIREASLPRNLKKLEIRASGFIFSD